MAGVRCPNCGITMAWVQTFFGQAGIDPTGAKRVMAMNCPDCNTAVIQLELVDVAGALQKRFTVWPRSTGRPPCPPEVVEPLRTDYTEACLVLADSPKASAALSRRCLQFMLRDAAGVKHDNLDKEIDEVIGKKMLVQSLAENLDAVRAIGNFAAHPMKSQQTGAILDVEPGEAEWNLDVVEALMDVFYVQPAMMKAKKAALNLKLAEANKPQLP